MKRILLAGTCLLACAGVLCAEEHTGNHPGLTVKNGQFMMNGKPYRGIGVNYFDAFLRVIGHNGQGPRLENDSWRVGLEALKQYEIPFIRMPINGFYPADWQLYLTNKPVFFAKLDEVMKELERLEIGVIPSFFWTFFTLPDLMEEPFDQWGNPDSKTRKTMREFTREIVSRYKSSPAVLMWEFGNEYMAQADLPGKDQGMGWLVPRLGTPKQRTERDKVCYSDINAAYVDFAATVRELDPARPIGTGDTLPRMSAWHLRNEKSWTHDSREQWLQIYKNDNPDPVNTLSGHLYYYDLPPAGNDAKASSTDSKAISKEGTPKVDSALKLQDHGIKGMSMTELLCMLQDVAKETGKPLFLGEFGTGYDLKDGELRKKHFLSVLDAVLAAKVELSAFWVFDFAWQPLDSATPWNDNVYILEVLRDANRRLQKETDSSVSATDNAGK